MQAQAVASIASADKSSCTSVNDYRASAFYRDFVEALRAGRRSGTDELTLQRCISSQKVDARRQNYADLKRGWLAMPELHLPLERIGSARWSVTGLTVTVNPELALAKADGTVIVLKLWLNKATPTPDAVRAMLWLLADQMPQLHSGGVPGVLDLRRHKLHTRDDARTGRAMRSFSLQKLPGWVRCGAD